MLASRTLLNGISVLSLKSSEQSLTISVISITLQIREILLTELISIAIDNIL